ncbi:MAG: hypothetical protein ACI8UO_006453 [Verrucomicrobiales bacterium]
MKQRPAILFLILSFAVVLSADEPAANPRNYEDAENASEYSGRQINGVLPRSWNNRTGPSEALVFNPDDLDHRRESIIDALWNDDEAAFLELAPSPLTGEGGLANQKFKDISRELKRLRDERFQTMRAHPVDPDKAKTGTNVWCRHQWMTLPESNRRKPQRGNLNLIFDAEDLSLRFVRIVAFEKSKDINILPYPSASIQNDPVVDRDPAAKKP